MDEQSGESKEEEKMGDGIGEYRNWRNWYQNEVDKEMEVVSETR